MKFKVGDKIRGISDNYPITNKNMLLGEVTEVLTHGIKIEVLKHKDSFYEGKEFFVQFPNGKFEIVGNLTISQLQSEIDKLSNEIGNYHNKIHSMRDRNNHMKEQLKELMKEEKNKPILDEKEKEYLSVVIRPFKDKVECIRKLMSFNKNKEYISIRMKRESQIDLPFFERNTMYKGMKSEKQYTLKELGLDE